MMSLFWYYRPEDAKGTNTSDYHEVLYCICGNGNVCGGI